jgi:hypothetical protein
VHCPSYETPQGTFSNLLPIHHFGLDQPCETNHPFIYCWECPHASSQMHLKIPPGQGDACILKN